MTRATTTFLGLLAMLTTLLLAGCDDGAADGEGVETHVVQLNWKPEPQFGGFYLLDDGRYEVRAGSADVSPVQLVGAGSVAFGVCSGDELLRARAMGNDAVALFAVFQTHPQGLMTPSSRGVGSLEELMAAGGTVAWQRGLPYVDYLKARYAPTFQQEVPSPFGDLTQLRREQDYAMQVFVTSEPIAAEAAGIEADTFLVAESGFNPYATVVVTSRDFLEREPAAAEALVADLRAAWGAYLADPTSANALMAELNPTMSPETFAAAAEAQRALIGEASSVGSMTQQRWDELARQMVEVGALDDPSSAADVMAAP